MFAIPPWLLALIALPGIVLHEFAHKLACTLCGVRVHQVKYFQFGNPAGFVVHDQSASFLKTFAISMGPLVVNTALGIGLSYFALHNAASHSIRQYILFWIAFACGMHAFPSNEDVHNIAVSSRYSLFIVLGYPLYWLFLVINKLRYFWFDIAYAAALLYIGIRVLHF